MRGWQYRRAVTVDKEQGSENFMPGDIARAEFYTGGKALSDGSDIRVTTASGAEVPLQVLAAGPGDRVEILFALKQNVRKYWVYWANPQAKPRQLDLEVKRGVIQEVRLNYKKPPQKAQDAVKIFTSASKRLGKTVTDRIFQGYNPLGPQPNIASRYTGFIKCPQDGKYIFRIASNDAGFLFVNDELVVSNGGARKPDRYYRSNGQIQLTKGTHKLTVLHVNRRGYPVMAVAWKPPSRNRASIIPPAAFEKIYHAQAEPAQRYGKKLTVDFTVSNEGESYCDDMYFQRYVFQAGATGNRSAVKRWEWKFGDGTTAQGEKVTHIFTRDGDCSVTLTARTTSDSPSCTNRVFVTREWKRAIWRKTEKTADHAEIVSQYDFADMDPQSLIGAFVLLKKAGKTSEMVNAAKALLKRDKLSSQAINKVLIPIVEAMVDDGQLAGAVNLLRSCENKSKWADVSAGLLLRAAGLLLELNKPDDALVLLQRITGHYASQTKSRVIRDARIATGDVYRMKGQCEKALHEYNLAGLSGVEESGLDFQRGNYTRHVEQYLSAGRFDWATDFLDKWENAIPVDRLGGYSSLLRIKTLIATGEHDRAAELAEIIVNVNPLGNYSDQILYQQIEAYRLMGKNEKAAEAAERLKRQYPESPLNKG